MAKSQALVRRQFEHDHGHEQGVLDQQRGSHEFSLGILFGFILGAIGATTWPVWAECCAQFDVDFNTQLEQERQDRFCDMDRDAQRLRELREEPCRR